jgi:ketosteroid isomerase-like protein
MISKTLHFFIALFLFSLNSYSQNPISLKDSLGIMNVMSLQQDAWNNGDIDSFMQGYLKSEELVFSGKSGPIYGWENTRKRYYSSYPNTQIMGKLNFTVKKIKSISLNSAYLIGEYYLKRSTEDSYGYFTLLWKKVDDNWLIVSDHTSAVK